MPPVGDLHRLRSPGPGGLGIGPAAVAAHHLDLGMLGQPRRDRTGVAALEHLDRATGLQVHDDRGVDVAAAQREVVDTDDPHVTDGRLR